MLLFLIGIFFEGQVHKDSLLYLFLTATASSIDAAAILDTTCLLQFYITWKLSPVDL